MDDFFNQIDQMLRQSQKSNPLPYFDSLSIKECLALLEDGWKIANYKSIPQSLDLSVIFAKSGQEKNIRLTLREQRLWMEILQKREELRTHVKSI